MDRGFDQMYEGVPPWDIGRPQPAFVRLANEGAIKGDVLDVGCGTGENALFLASRGFRVLGLDGASRAIAKARSKAAMRAVPIEFQTGDALELGDLGRLFDTIIDCGLFHTFEDTERPIFVRSLRTALRPKGSYFMLAFSDRVPGDWGPRRVTKREIRDTFAKGFEVRSIEESAFETNPDTSGGKVHAWLSSIVRI